METSAVGWFIVDVVAVVLLGGLIAYGVVQSRRRREDIEKRGLPPEAANWPSRTEGRTDGEPR